MTTEEKKESIKKMLSFLDKHPFFLNKKEQEELRESLESALQLFQTIEKS